MNNMMNNMKIFAGIFIILLFARTGLFAGEAPESFPYALNIYTDAGLLAAGGSLVGLSKYLANKKHDMTAAEISGLDRDDVNPVDRIATRYYSQSADTSSYTLEYVSAALPAIAIVPRVYGFEWYNAFAIVLMYGEAMLINWGLTDSVKNIVNRKRPYLYHSDISMEDKLSHGKENLRSFYSGHTSTSFCAAIFLSKVFGDIYPHSWVRYVVYTVSIGTASAVGYLRVRSGKHYPTDVAAGAVMGGVVGYLVPVMHYKKDRSVTVVPFTGDSNGIAVSMIF